MFLISKHKLYLSWIEKSYTENKNPRILDITIPPNKVIYALVLKDSDIAEYI